MLTNGMPFNPKGTLSYSWSVETAQNDIPFCAASACLVRGNALGGVAGFGRGVIQAPKLELESCATNDQEAVGEGRALVAHIHGATDGRP